MLYIYFSSKVFLREMKNFSDINHPTIPFSIFTIPLLLLICHMVPQKFKKFYTTLKDIYPDC